MAVAAVEAGEKVVILDTDPQGSANSWGLARNRHPPAVLPSAAVEIGQALSVAAKQGVTLAIIDAAPDATRIMRIARVVDLVVVPVRPTALDMDSVGSAAKIITAAGVSAVFVLSACPFRSPDIVKTQKLLAKYGWPIAAITITDRRIFARAVGEGRTATEMDCSGKGAQEVKSLWYWIRAQLR